MSMIRLWIGGWLRPRSSHVYYLLAAVNLATIVVALLLGNCFLNAYLLSAQSADDFLQQQAQCLALMRLAADVNAPGNDIFKSRDIVAEQARLEEATARYSQGASAVREPFSRTHSASQAAALLSQLDDANNHVQQVDCESRRIFALLESNNLEQATAGKAVMDRELSSSLDGLVSLCRAAQHAREEAVAADVASAHFLERVQWSVAAGAVMVVLLASWYGHRLARQVSTQQQALAERDQRLISEQKRAEAEIERHVSDVEQARRVLEERTTELNVAQESLATQNKKLQEQAEELQRTRQQTEEISRAKSEFLANMIHEIRGPMTAILGYSENLICPDLAADDRTLAVQSIRKNGEHLLEIINDILDVSKIEAGKLEVERVPCSLVQVLADVASLMRVRAAAKKLDLRVEYLSEIPDTIQSDPTRLRQILINLLGNAIKVTQKGSVRISAQVCDAKGPQPTIRLDVIDTGVGLSQDQIERCFHPFAQAELSNTRRFGGTGLGLTISQRLAEILGGRIAVISQPGKGTTLSMTLPAGSLEGAAWLSQPSEAMARLRRQEEAPHASQATLQCRVLLAEDGPDNQRLISFLLQKAGAEVEVVDNGQTAVQRVWEASEQGEPFDVILMDMHMPVLDGYAAASTLRQRGYDGPIIALTAHAMSGDRQKCLAAGCDDFATKPIDRAQLLRTVARYACPTRTTTLSGFGIPRPGA